MPEKITKTQRWLDLIAYLVSRRTPVTVEEIMTSVPAYAEKLRTGKDTDAAAARRMFERDKDELRALGLPLSMVSYDAEYGTELQQGYKLASRDFYLPYLKLVGGERRARGRRQLPEIEIRPDEVAVALDALRRAAALPAFPFLADARSALRKLEFDLDLAAIQTTPVAFAEPATAIGATAAGDPGTPELRERVMDLVDAITRRKRVRFVYHGVARPEPTRRDVAGYALLCRHGVWYLIGHDALRSAVRVFRLDRMASVEVSRSAPRTADYDVPADFDVGQYTSAHPWELGSGEESTIEVDVRFEFPTSLWADRSRHGDLVEELAGGAAIRRFRAADPVPLLRWVLGFAGEARVVAPASLRAAFEQLARSVLALYDDPPGELPPLAGGLPELET